MTKKLIFQGAFKSYLLSDELQAALSWNPVTLEGTSRVQSKPDETEVYIYADDDTDENAVQAVIDAHDPNVLSQGEQTQAHKDDVNLRFAAANLTGKSPQQIYTAMQNKMDGWANLADARADLRNWLPLMAAGIVWLVKNGD